MQGWTAVCGGQAYNPKLVTAAQWAEFQDIWSKLNAGTIDVKAADQEPEPNSPRS